MTRAKTGDGFIQGGVRNSIEGASAIAGDAAISSISIGADADSHSTRTIGGGDDSGSVADNASMATPASLIGLRKAFT